MSLLFFSRSDRWKMLTFRQALKIWLLEHRAFSYAFATVSILVLAITIGLQAPALSPTSSASISEQAPFQAMVIEGEEEGVSPGEVGDAVSHGTIQDRIWRFITLFVGRFE